MLLENGNRVIAVEPNAEMREAGERLLKAFPNFSSVAGSAEATRLAYQSVDFVTMGYALRHVPDLVAAFREFHRVLRPGGTVLALEIGKPTRPLTRAFVATYLGRVVPLLCRWVVGVRSQQLMAYYWETIANCVAPEVIVSAMQQGGFGAVRCDVDLDLFRSYTGRKS